MWVAAIAVAIAGCDSLVSGHLSIVVTLEDVVPRSSPASGGQEISVLGRNFHEDAALELEGLRVTSLTRHSSERLSFVTTPGPFGLKDLTVTNPGGSHHTLENALAYSANRINFVTPNVLFDRRDGQVIVVGVLDAEPGDDVLWQSDDGAYQSLLNRGSQFETIDPGLPAIGFLAARDVDQDGLMDVVLQDGLYLGLGDGRFSSRVPGPFPDAVQVLIGKFSGHDPELMVIGPGDPSAVTIFSLANGRLQQRGHEQQVDLCMMCCGADQPRQFAVGDLTGDGSEDVVFLRDRPGISEGPLVTVPGPDLDFVGAMANLDLDHPETSDWRSSTCPRAIEITRVGRDEQPEVVTYAYRVQAGHPHGLTTDSDPLCQNDSTDALTHFPWDTPFRTAVAVAACGRGELEIAVWNGIQPTLETKSELPIPAATVAVADLDGDPIPDLIATTGRGVEGLYGAKSTEVAFVPIPGAAVSWFPDSWGAAKVIRGQQAGRSVIAGAFRNVLAIFALDGEQLQLDGTVSLPDTDNIRQLRACDIDGDGNHEWIVGGTGTRLVSFPGVFVLDGKGKLLQQEMITDTRSADPEDSGLVTADLNGDGHCDVLFATKERLVGWQSHAGILQASPGHRLIPPRSPRKNGGHRR